MATGFEKLSYIELLEFQQKVADAIVLRKQEEKANLRSQLETLAADSGFRLDEVMGMPQPERKRGKVATKYHHPKDASLKWTGRGRKPLWLVAELEKGRKLESFLIK